MLPSDRKHTNMLFIGWLGHFNDAFHKVGYTMPLGHLSNKLIYLTKMVLLIKQIMYKYSTGRVTNFHERQHTRGPSSYSVLSQAKSVLSTWQFWCRKRLA